LTSKGRAQGRRVLRAVQYILEQGPHEGSVIDLPALVRYCANELDVPPQLPLALLAEATPAGTEAWLADERLEAALQDEDGEQEHSGVFLRTDHGLVPVAM
jgi:hypothetical protein